MNSPHRLTVWTKADLLVQRLCNTIPSDQGAPHADLADRLRKAVTEIPLAIDAGSRAHVPTEFADHLEYAMARTHEVQYLLSLHEALGRLATSECARLTARTDQVQRMLGGLLRTIEQGVPPRSGSGRSASPANVRPRRRRPRSSPSALVD